MSKYGSMYIYIGDYPECYVTDKILHKPSLCDGCKHTVECFKEKIILVSKVRCDET